jgi:hypothetical protein
MIISRYWCDRPSEPVMTRCARGSVARIGKKIVGFAPHHVGGGCSDLMAFARIETCSTGVADVLA